ncbi:probable ribose-5-phosphate isomerase B [Stegodyphus dumicola]|uniref:probable ribose-5-phosphate isomerase B n=1 Tax=Stegodyphus dumicola TaxID=202533 RepID=UPI0015AF2E9C|nr:probable ribose-5-phosphate isomerase B [Stegodyphus dumicola]XP_035219152.1 probable ribose-5-phosphate isomerase B [Stegodyphus dumicola]
MIKKIIIASDHAGYDLKEAIKKHFSNVDIKILDLGANDPDKAISYAQQGQKLANTLLKTKHSLGIGICGTGIGISIAVNRFKGVRGAKVNTLEEAKLAKKHNDANVLIFGGRIVTPEKAIRMINHYLKEDFEQGRHLDRINQLDK